MIKISIMFSHRLIKFQFFFMLFLTCSILISGHNKFKRVKDIDEPLSGAEQAKETKEAASTVVTLLKELKEVVDTELDKEIKEVEKEAKEEAEKELKGEVSETSDSEREEKESLEGIEEIANAEKEELEEEQSEKDLSTDETSKVIDLSSTTKTIPNENIEAPNSGSPMLVTELSVDKEKGPDDTFIVWNSKGKICLLAKFHVTFSIVYSSEGGEEKAEVTVPKHGTAKGKCETSSRSPLLQISWQKYAFTMIFNKTEEESWIVTSIELTYDTSDKLFDRATNVGKKTARSKILSLFETPLTKSFYCPAQEVVLLYSGNKHVVTARMKEIQLQPYGVEDGEFSPAHRCNKVVINGPDEAPYIQDETVPLAVGCTLALITLLILLGFSFHRAYNAAKVDYNTME